MVASKQKASVYRRGTTLFLVTASQSEGRYGLWIESGPHFTRAVTAGADAIGDGLAKALEASRTGVPYPADPQSLAVPLIEAAGVKTWNAFVKGTELYHVERGATGVQITPTSPERGGFTRRTDAVIHLSKTSTAFDLGEGLLRAMSSDDES